MSTKTTFKRVALVAVAALGLGVVSSVAPANAAAVSFTVNTASQTVVGTYATTNNSTKGAVAFKIQVKDNATTPVVANLSNGETITASVIAVPAKSLASGDTLPLTSDIGFLSVKNSTLLTADTGTAGTLSYLDNNCLYPVAQDATYAARGQYCIGVMPSKNIAGWGEYTIALDLKDVNGNILQRTSVKYKMVATAADSGAVVTLAIAGTAVAGETYLQTTTKYINASLRDANGGLVVLNDTSTTTRQPALTGTLESAAGTALNTLTAADTGSTTADAYDAAAVSNDGDYGLIPSAAVSSSVSTTAASVVRVRYGLVNVTGSISAYRAATSFGSTSLRSVTGTGIYTATETTTASGAISYKVPMTTGSIAIKYTVKDSAGTAIADEPITITPTWSGVNAADVSGVSGTSAVSKTDASGVVTYTVTQANVIAGSSVVVAVTGIGTGSFGSVTLTWGVPTVTSASLTPSSTFKIVAAGSASFKIKVKDQFGAAMSGVVLQPSLSATSANYSATSMATVTTGADGTATVTLTGGANATSDALTWTHAVAGSLGTQTASYVTTVPVIATLTGYNNTSEGAATYPTPFSTTALGSTGTMLVSAGLDYSASLAVTRTSIVDTINAFQVVAKDSAGAVVTGVPVTVTASAGSYFTDSCSGATGLLVTSKTCYPASTTGAVTIVGVVNKTGTATFTFTAGTVVSSQTVFAINATTDARYVALSGDSTAVAGSNTTPNMKATVTDRFGNAVAGVTVQLSVTGAGSLGGGAKLGSFATDTNGEVNFNLQSNAEGTSTVNAYLTTAQDSASTAGKSVSATVDSTLTAGVRSATASLAWSAGSSALDQAQAATDAAAEATDAANAATDAANAAAEAADAATAAAQDAADAVAALSAQVASLISGLKAQLTALTNLVIKIQKKVKA